MIYLIATLIYYAIMAVLIIATIGLAIGSIVNLFSTDKEDEGSAIFIWIAFAGAIILWTR